MKPNTSESASYLCHLLAKLSWENYSSSININFLKALYYKALHYSLPDKVVKTFKLETYCKTAYEYSSTQI